MILIVGATGNVGGAITQTLLAQGKPVRILVRAQSNYKPLENAGAKVVFGDLKDRASLAPACQGVDVVITTANTALRGGDDTPESVDWQGTRNLVDAAKAAGVKQFIYMSAMIADAKSPVPFLAAKGKAAEYVQASGLPYTVLAPNVFMEVWLGMIVGMPVAAGQPVTIVGTGARKHSMISVADVIGFTVGAIGHPAAINQTLVFGGPAGVSFLDAVAAFERALGKTIPVRHIQPGEMLPNMPEMVSGLAAALDAYDSPIDSTGLAKAFGVKLTTLDEFVARSLSQPA